MKRSRISRRRFLKGAVTATATAVATLARGHRPELAEGRCLGGKSRAARAGEAYQVYLPYSVAPDRPHGPSKLGIHTILPGNALQYIRSIAEQGATLAAVKAVDNFSWLRHVKTISPGTLRVGRSTAFYDVVDMEKDLAAEAQRVMDVILPQMALHREYVDYWEITNEMDPPGRAGYRRHAELHFHFMDIAEREGFKVALFTWNAGTPEWEEMEAVVETGVFARARQGGHILSLHEATFSSPVTAGYGEPLPGRLQYPDRGTLCCRYRWLYEDFLKPRNEVIPLLMTEFIIGAYTENGLSATEWVQQMSWYDDHVREDDYVLGCCPFTLGPVGSVWPRYDYKEAMPEYIAYIVSLSA